MIILLSVENRHRDEAIKNIAETKVFKTIIMNVLLTLTYSIVLDELINVALAVEHRSADLEERDTSA